MCAEKKNDVCKRERLVLIPTLPSKEKGSQGACPLLNRDLRCEEVSVEPYAAQGQSRGMHRDPGGRTVGDLQCWVGVGGWGSMGE